MNSVIRDYIIDGCRENLGLAVEVINMIECSGVPGPDIRAIAEADGVEVMRTFTPDDTLPLWGIDPRALDAAYGAGTARVLVSGYVDLLDEFMFGPDSEDTVDLALDEAASRLGVDLDAVRDIAASLDGLAPDEPVGGERVRLACEAGEALRGQVEDIAPFAPCYRIDDFGEYVTEATWDAFWRARPAWMEAVFMLADNGAYTSGEVAKMTLARAMAAYRDPSTEFDIAYYTEADEDGIEA